MKSGNEKHQLQPVSTSLHDCGFLESTCGVWESTVANEFRRSKFPSVYTIESRFLNMTECGFVQFILVKDFSLVYKKIVKKVKKNLRSTNILLNGESIFGDYEEKGMVDDVL